MKFKFIKNKWVVFCENMIAFFDCNETKATNVKPLFISSALRKDTSIVFYDYRLLNAVYEVVKIVLFNGLVDGVISYAVDNETYNKIYLNLDMYTGKVNLLSRDEDNEMTETGMYFYLDELECLDSKIFQTELSKIKGVVYSTPEEVYSSLLN